MINTPVIKILRSFSADERKKFRDFINSPYHNKKIGAIKLYDSVERFAPEFRDENLDRKEVWKKIFPGKSFNYGIMKNLIYDLTKLAENFLCSEIYFSNELQKNYDLLSSFLQRDIRELFESRYSAVMKTTSTVRKKRDYVSEDFYYYMWRISALKWNFDTQLSHEKEYEEVIERSSDSFAAYILIHAFILYMNTEAQMLEHNFEIKDNSVDIFLRDADSNGTITRIISATAARDRNLSDAVSIYYKMYLSLTAKDSAGKFFDFRDSLEKSGAEFTRRDLTALYITLLNCLTHLNSPGIVRGEEYLKIYDTMISRNLLFSENERVWDQDFLGYITTAANYGKSQSIEAFIRKAESRMQSATKENLIRFAKAHLYFAKGEFAKSLDCSLRTSFDLFQMKYYAKSLEIKNYYELGDYESFLMAMDSFKHFLSKNKTVSERWRTAQTEFCKNVSMLFRLKEKFDEYELEKLKQRTNPNNRNSWLNRKVMEIESHKSSVKPGRKIKE